MRYLQIKIVDEMKDINLKQELNIDNMPGDKPGICLRRYIQSAIGRFLDDVKNYEIQREKENKELNDLITKDGLYDYTKDPTWDIEMGKKEVDVTTDDVNHKVNRDDYLDNSPEYYKMKYE